MNYPIKKIILFVTTLIFFSFSIQGQENLQEVNNRINQLEDENRYLNLDSSLVQGISVTDFIYKTDLEINRELSNKLQLLRYLADPLISTTNLETPPNSGGNATNIFAKNYAISKTRIAGLIEENNQVAKITGFSKQPITNPLDLLTDRQLRTSHFQMVKLYAENNGFPDRKDIQNIFIEEIIFLEAGMQKRGFIPVNTTGIADFSKKMSRTIQLMSEINYQVKLEALYFADNSPLVLDAREQVALLSREIREIYTSMGVTKDNLPKFRDLLTDYTIQDRISSLELGLKNAEVEYQLKRHYANEKFTLAKNLEKAIVQEKKWYVEEKLHKITETSWSNRGPPPPPPPIDFEANPIPKQPSGGSGNTLDDFLDKTQIEKINNKSRKTFDRVYRRQVEKFKAATSKANWASVKNTPTGYSFFPESDAINYFKSQAKEYYKVLPIDPIEASLIDVEINEAIKFFGNKQGINKNSFLENDLPTLNEILKDLRIAKKYRQKSLAGNNPLDNHITEKELAKLNEAEQAIEEIRKKSKINLEANLQQKIRLTGDSFNRPPPEVEKWIQNKDVSIHKFNEIFYLNVLNEQRRILEKHQVINGNNTNIKKRLTTLKQIDKINTTARLIGNYRELSPYISTINATESFLNNLEKGGGFDNLELRQFLNKMENQSFFEEIRAKRNNIYSKMANIYADLQRSGNKAQMPKSMYSDLKMINKNITATPENIKNNLNRTVDVANMKWSTNQDLNKLKDMKFSKAPGGIWLSPNGNPISRVILPEQNWEIIPEYQSCPLDQKYTTWQLDDTTKICFPKTDQQFSNYQHWTNTLQPWF